MNLRIIETFKEIFSEPRFFGFVFVCILPIIAIFGECNGHYKIATNISLIWFIVCFLIVRFTLD